MVTSSKICKDCTGWKQLARPAPYPGPRCATHHRKKQTADKKRAHEQRVQAKYGLAPGEYDRLYEAQGGVCYICMRATGKTKRLSVDHDHKTGLVRGLLCSPCNKTLGHFRDNPEIAYRAYLYLTDPPAQTILGERRAKDREDRN